MRYILLFVLLPLFVFSQERKVAYMDEDSTWVINDSVRTSANFIYDSLGTILTADSMRYENDSMITLIGHTISKVQVVFYDLLFVRKQGPSLYTDFLSGGCATVCKNGTDCNGCYKKSDCSGCGCNSSGVCLEGNYGVSFEGSISNMIRSKLIRDNNDSIPGE